MIKLRRFSLSDLEQIIEIEKISFPKRKPFSEDYFKKLYQKSPGRIVVAEDKGKILGYIIGGVQKDCGKIISIAVHPLHRKRGIGKELVNFLIEHFKKNGLKKFLLLVRRDNLVAISFYKNLGFQISKIIKNYYRNGDDAFLMEREIHPC
jgi:ribosomal-protein-alanine N-acetyltransferase